MKFCYNCGETIDDAVFVCPNCNTDLSNDPENTVIVYNESASTVQKQKGMWKERDNKVFRFIRKHHKQVVILLAILALIFIAVAISIIASGTYRDNSNSYSEYVDNYEENLLMSAAYGGTGILGNGYKAVASGWKTMADEALSELWIMRIITIVFAVLGIGCGVLSFIVYRMKKKL